MTAPRAQDLMFALRLEDGRRWGEAAADFQIRDAAAIFAKDGPTSHYLTRPRGGSKTSDIAGLVLSWLVTEAPLGARGFVVASSSDQASILVDAAAGFVARTPELHGLVTVENEKLIAPNGAWLRVLTADGSSAWGLRGAFMLVCDEFAQWPETRSARRVWTAVLSTKQKTPGCRLVLITSAGEPSHFSHDVLTEAKRERQREVWRVSETPGPIPWIDTKELESQRYMLRDDEFARLHLNQWSETDDRLVAPEDLEAAAILGGPLDPAPGTRYIVTVDIGVKEDATVVCVAHCESTSDDARAPKRVVVDRIRRWKGSRRRPVQLAEVEEFIAWASVHYNRAQVYADPSQAVGLVQRLNASGVKAAEFAFTAQSVGQIGSALALALRNRQLSIPDDADLLDELGRVRLRTIAGGAVRLDHDRGDHDDQAVCLGMAVHLLLGKLSGGAGSAWLAFYKQEVEKAQAAAAAEPPHSYFFTEQQAPSATRPQQCREHRYFGPERRCAYCGATPEEVGS